MNLFKKYKISFLNEKWEVVKNAVWVNAIPRMHEIIYLRDEETYFRVVNVVYNIHNNKQNIFIIIEQYLDDDALIEKKLKKT